MTTVDEDKQQILERIQIFMKLYAEGDVDGLAQMIYTSDCVLMPPDGPTLHGSEVKNYIRNSDVKRYVSENIETLMEGNMAISRDRFTAYYADGSMASKGNNLGVWIKSDGLWKVKYDMWTNRV